MSERDPTEMELRVAKAANDAFMEDSFDGYPADSIDRALWLQVARAAIRAMYEPNETMLAAYMNALDAKMRRRWRAMVDAASPPDL